MGTVIANTPGVGYSGGMAVEKYMGYPQVAQRLGVTVNVCRKYLTMARTNRANGESNPGDIPEPDATYGQSPVWKPTTIETWMNRRPGRGVGGGRKNKP